MNVLIIGLRNKERPRLKVNKNINVDIIDSSNITNRSFKNLQTYDYVINVCKFASHLTEYMCNNHKGFIRLRPTQGISTVNTILSGLHYV